jgi:predicted DNA-binding protein (MmcQ/YjbR family)
MTLSGKPKPDVLRAEEALAKLALRFPEVTEDRPWGHRAFKVRKKKVFLFLASDEGGLGLSVKLPHSGVMALELPFTEPTGYGLGKSGWVSARFARGKDLPVALVCEWLEESYRAIAPKTLSRTLDGKAGDKGASSAKASRPARKVAVKRGGGRRVSGVRARG